MAAASNEVTARRRRNAVVFLPLIAFAALTALFFYRLGAGDPSRLPSALIGRPIPVTDLPPLPGLERDGKPEYAVIPMAECAESGQWSKSWRTFATSTRHWPDAIGASSPSRSPPPSWDGASPISAWREHRGLSQSQLAAAAGLRVEEFAQFENGTRKPAPATLRKIAKLLRARTSTT